MRSREISIRIITVQKTAQYEIKLRQTTVQASFFGTTFTLEGHKLEDGKFQAINKMLQPTNVRDS